MFAFCRSLIGWSALSLGCVMTLTATSVQAQDAGPAPDAGVPESAPDGGVSPDAGANADSGLTTEPEATPEPTAPAEPEVTFEPGADAETGIRGRIVDAKSGVGIEMAVVLIVDSEKSRTAITGENGRYEINVPPGTYTVRSYFDMYHGARLANVRVTRGRFDEVNLLLDPVNEAEEVAVEEIEIPYRADTTTAAAQDQLRRENAGVSEGMGSQQMSQSGASDAGSAAKRVVGVTVDGANLVIRGLGGRYSRVYMNGVPLPSTDPDSPSVDLDLFPTNVIDSLTVTKAFLPNMPADFAGGVLDIGTVTFPRDFTLELGLSGQYSSMSTLRNRLDYTGGSYDALGFDDGTRALPSQVPPTDYNPRNFSDEEELAIGGSFKNVWQYRRTSALPKLGVDLTLGDSVDLSSGSRFGYLIALAYDHDDVRTLGTSRKVGSDANRDGKPDTAGYSNYPLVEVGSEEVQLTGIATASLDIGTDHSLTALSMFIRSASDEVGYRRGNDTDYVYELPTEKWQFQYTARQMWFNQALGDHRNIGGTRLRLRWNGFYAHSLRDEPDRRTFIHAPNNNMDARPSWKTQDAQRIFLGLDGADGGGGSSLRFPLWSEGWGTVGASARTTQRDFSVRRFVMRRTNDFTDEDGFLPPDELFAEGNLGRITELAAESTRNDDSFASTQSTVTGYGMLETPLVGPLSLAGGVRAEYYIQRLASQSPFPPDEDTPPPVRADATQLNLLPGVALKYDLSDKMVVRLAYGMTVGRPQTRELAPVLYFDFVRDRNVVGNINLKTTVIHNADARWEWFFAEAQILAASIFYKEFTDPIELYLGPEGTSAIYGNTAGATALGAELEFRTKLDLIAETLRNFEFGANLTLVHSRVTLTPEQTMAQAPGPRQMFGAAPYVLNLSLRFSDPVTKASLGLVYNLVGPTLSDVGRRAESEIFPNIELLPIHSLDLIGTWRVNEHLKLKLKWKNVLFQAKRYDQGGVIVASRDPGTFVSLGLDYAY